MEYKCNKNKTIRFTEGNVSIEVPLNIFSIVANDVDREFYFREDVMRELDGRIESKELPETAKENEQYIEAVLDCYSEYRRDADGDDCGMSWTDCLDQAFSDVDFENYED